MDAVEAYIRGLWEIRATGAAVAETSYYPALANLLNEIGKTLKPKVRCILQTANVGAGNPDGGLFTSDQLRQGRDPEPEQGQLPARGAIEVKPTSKDVRTTARTKQVQKYLATYGLVLVTNYREFLVVGLNAKGGPEPLEGYALAENETDFWEQAAHARRCAGRHGAQLTEYLKRAMLHAAPLTEPKDVAWFLASYARDALARVERQKDLPALADVRASLEEALGMKFTGEKGEHFFRSTLVQTIFYGVFSAWVLWHRENPDRSDEFDWRVAEWSLRVPIIRALYEHVVTPTKLGPLGLPEVLNWTGAVLTRADRATFFRRFQEEQAVQYFYEPFLEAFDPGLRKQLGVWYTPREIVQYQVARVDTVLREELDIPDGLADPKVVVLDPCCGTGAYLVEVLRKIAETLRTKGGDALIASDLKAAAMNRVFGFEILPAPFVVSHLQLGLELAREGAPLGRKEGQRVGVYLTNALTGWEPPEGPKQYVFPWPELGEERDAAEHVKREEAILVILGNPPYNAFAGVSPAEEQGLVDPYKEGLNKPVEDGGWGIRKFNLDDLYVRFFRLAERRIAEMTGRGVVSFISNHSWVADPSFVVLRKRLLDNFDCFWIENLHGNRKISEYAPDGRTSETIFAIGGFSVGIQQGVATSLWVKTGKRRKRPPVVLFRDDISDAKAQERRRQLLYTLDAKNFDAAYPKATPCPENRYSFRPEDVAAHYVVWPSVRDLCALPPSNGLMEKRGGALIDLERSALAQRMRVYFDKSLDWEAYTLIQGDLTRDQGRFDPRAARAKALAREGYGDEHIVRYAVRAFDTRWCYYTGVRPLWNEPRPALWAQCWVGNEFFVTRPAGVASPEGIPLWYTSFLGDNDFLRGHAYYFPMRVRNGERLEERQQATLFDALGDDRVLERPVANLVDKARDYLASLRVPDPDTDAAAARLIWMHALAIACSPAYLGENADGIRRDWPRVPLPAKRKALKASAELGRRVAALLDTEVDVPGATAGKVGPLLRTVGVLSRVGGGTLDPDTDDLAVTAGWGHTGKRGATMPGKGKLLIRKYSDGELEAIDAEAAKRGSTRKALLKLLGADTRDVYLNDVAYWRNVPAGVWEYYIGGYQVVKKWLSYREAVLFGRPLRTEEARYVTEMVRRITALVLLQPALDTNYRAVKADTYDWPRVDHSGPVGKRE